MDAHISDLFFNYSHDAYHDLYKYSDSTEGVDPVEERAAIRKDAEEFAGSVERAFGVVLSPDWLVDDFFKRL